MSNIKLDMTDLPIWDYLSKEKGPQSWRVLCPEFSIAAKGAWQSPIMLKQTDSHLTYHQSSLSFNYQRDTFVTRKANYTLQMDNTTLRSHVRVDDVIYTLQNIHFHIPSEHFIEAQQQEIEFHFVHRNEKEELLVVACLFSLKKSTRGEASGDAFKNVPPIFKQQLVLNPNELLPENKSFFHYQGSLTTPPTTDQVQWYVFSEVQPISARSLQRWRNFTRSPITNRPLQPLNNRVVTFCHCENGNET